MVVEIKKLIIYIENRKLFHEKTKYATWGNAVWMKKKLLNREREIVGQQLSATFHFLLSSDFIDPRSMNPVTGFNHDYYLKL